MALRPEQSREVIAIVLGANLSLPALQGVSDLPDSFRWIKPAPNDKAKNRHLLRPAVDCSHTSTWG